jgi:Domain of unknown function (DUF4304)
VLILSPSGATSGIETIAEIFAKPLGEAGFKRRRTSWYWQTPEVVAVVSLYRSRFAPQYFCQVGFWLREIAEAEYPKAWDCHVSARWEQFANEKDDRRFSALMDLGEKMREKARRNGFEKLINGSLLPLLKSGHDLDGVRALVKTGHFGSDPEAREALGV